MALDFGIFSSLGTLHWFLILIIFILFVLSMKKVFRIAMNALWIVVAAVLFPLFANRVLGLPVPADTGSIILLAMAGLGLYFVYLIAKSVHSILGLAEKVGKKYVPKVASKGKGKSEPKEKTRPAPEKPRMVTAKQYFVQAGKTKTEKELFSDYLIIEDKEAVTESKEATKKAEKPVKPGKEEYVEIEDNEITEEYAGPEMDEEAAEEELADLTEKTGMAKEKKKFETSGRKRSKRKKKV